jgi:hypothetical protein
MTTNRKIARVITPNMCNRKGKSYIIRKKGLGLRKLFTKRQNQKAKKIEKD